MRDEPKSPPGASIRWQAERDGVRDLVSVPLRPRAAYASLARRGNPYLACLMLYVGLCAAPPLVWFIHYDSGATAERQLQADARWSLMNEAQRQQALTQARSMNMIVMPVITALSPLLRAFVVGGFFLLFFNLVLNTEGLTLAASLSIVVHALLPAALASGAVALALYGWPRVLVLAASGPALPTSLGAWLKPPMSSDWATAVLRNLDASSVLLVWFMSAGYAVATGKSRRLCAATVGLSWLAWILLGPLAGA